MSQPNIQSKFIQWGFSCPNCLRVRSENYDSCCGENTLEGYYDEDGVEYTEAEFKQWQKACELGEES